MDRRFPAPTLFADHEKAPGEIVGFFIFLVVSSFDKRLYRPRFHVGLERGWRRAGRGRFQPVFGYCFGYSAVEGDVVLGRDVGLPFQKSAGPVLKQLGRNDSQGPL